MIRFLAASLLLTACVPQLDYGERCGRNSECAPPYTCVLGHCAEECRSQTDCTFPGRCVSVLGVRRCFYDDQPVDRCRIPSDCGDDTLICQDGACFNGCASCAELGAVCEGAVCVRRESFDGGSSDAGSTDAGDAEQPDGGGAVFSPHVPCTGPGDCPGAACVSDDGAAAVCRVPCTGPAPDAGTPGPDDPECASRICVRPDMSVTEAYCALTCDPLDSASCPTGETCDLLGRVRPTTGEYREIWGCRLVAMPTLLVDDVCRSDTADLCPAGTHCTNDGPMAYCHELCDVTLPCRDGRVCARLHSDDEAYPVGTCMFP